MVATLPPLWRLDLGLEEEEEEDVHHLPLSRSCKLRRGCQGPPTRLRAFLRCVCSYFGSPPILQADRKLFAVHLVGSASPMRTRVFTKKCSPRCEFFNVQSVTAAQCPSRKKNVGKERNALYRLWLSLFSVSGVSSLFLLLTFLAAAPPAPCQGICIHTFHKADRISLGLA